MVEKIKTNFKIWTLRKQQTLFSPVMIFTNDF